MGPASRAIGDLLRSFWRLAARLVGFLLLVALAVAGLALAIFTIDGGIDGLSLPHLAELLGMPSFRDSVGGLLDDLEASGVDGKPLLGGIGAILVGVLLLVGVFADRPERSFKAAGSESEVDGSGSASAAASASDSGGESDSDSESDTDTDGDPESDAPSDLGRIGARRRPLAAAAEALAEGVDGVTATRVQARPSRRGGRVRVDATRPETASGQQVEAEVARALEPVRKTFGARIDVRSEIATSGSQRVE